MPAYGGRQREFAKLLYDIVKHCTTISAGALILMATFMDKLVHNRDSIPVILSASGAFVFSIVAGLMLTFLVAVFNPTLSLEKENRIRAFAAVVLLALVLISFGIALGSLAQFVAINLKTI
jgi:ABC-type polysaccharide/polyol phosphate export permease